MLKKQVESLNKITQDIENWINHKHNNSEVNKIKFFLTVFVESNLQLRLINLNILLKLW